MSWSEWSCHSAWADSGLFALEAEERGYPLLVRFAAAAAELVVQGHRSTSRFICTVAQPRVTEIIKLTLDKADA